MKIIFPLKCWGPASLSSSDQVPWTCLLHWNNHLHFTALKAVFWLGVFLSNGIGNFMKLCARRRLCNSKIISLLAAVQASTNEPSFPFGLCSDWSLRPCSPSVLSSVISCCSFVAVNSLLLQELLCNAREDAYSSQSPTDEAGEKPCSTPGPGDSSWFPHCRFDLTWQVLTWGRMDS